MLAGTDLLAGTRLGVVYNVHTIPINTGCIATSWLVSC